MMGKKERKKKGKPKPVIPKPPPPPKKEPWVGCGYESDRLGEKPTKA